MPCLQWWPTETVWGWEFDHNKHIATLCQSTPLVFANAAEVHLESDRSSESSSSQWLHWGIYSKCTFNTHSLFWQGISDFQSLLHDEIFAFVCLLWTFYQLPWLEDPALDLKTLVSIWVEWEIICYKPFIHPTELHMLLLYPLLNCHSFWLKICIKTLPPSEIWISFDCLCWSLDFSSSNITLEQGLELQTEFKMQTHQHFMFSVYSISFLTILNIQFSFFTTAEHWVQWNYIL